MLPLLLALGVLAQTPAPAAIPEDPVAELFIPSHDLRGEERLLDGTAVLSLPLGIPCVILCLPCTIPIGSLFITTGPLALVVMLAVVIAPVFLPFIAAQTLIRIFRRPPDLRTAPPDVVRLQLDRADHNVVEVQDGSLWLCLSSRHAESRLMCHQRIARSSGSEKRDAALMRALGDDDVRIQLWAVEQTTTRSFANGRPDATVTALARIRRHPDPRYRARLGALGLGGFEPNERTALTDEPAAPQGATRGTQIFTHAGGPVRVRVGAVQVRCLRVDVLGADGVKDMVISVEDDTTFVSLPHPAGDTQLEVSLHEKPDCPATLDGVTLTTLAPEPGPQAAQ